MRFLLAALFCLVPFQPTLAADPDPIMWNLIPGEAPDAAVVRGLIDQLGNDKFDLRQEAYHKLRDLGSRLLKSPVLEAHGLRSPDPEIKFASGALKEDLAYPYKRISEEEIISILSARLIKWMVSAFREVSDNNAFFDIINTNFTLPNMELVKAQKKAAKESAYDGQQELKLEADPARKGRLDSPEDLSQHLHDLFSGFLAAGFNFKEVKPRYPYFHYVSAENPSLWHLDLVCYRTSAASLSLQGPWEDIPVLETLAQNKNVPLNVLLDADSFAKELKTVSFRWELSKELDDDERHIHFSIYLAWKDNPRHSSEYIFDPRRSFEQMQLALRKLIANH